MTDASTREANQNLRAARDRAIARAERAEAQVAELARVELENAAYRAGLDPDTPAVKLLLQQHQGEPTPEALRSAFVDLTTSVLAQNLGAGRSLTELAHQVDGTPADDGPSPAELAHAQAQSALVTSLPEGPSPWSPDE